LSGPGFFFTEGKLAELNPESPLPWHISNYVKGLAILAVVGNHYAILYFQSRSAFANGLMTIFYLMAGAGIYISLSRESDGAGPGARAWLKFIYKRGSRIYPLYWLAYAITTVWLIRLGIQSGFDGVSFVTALVGAPSNSSGVFWFVTSILECYLVAPLLFPIARRLDANTNLAIVLMSIAVLLPVSLYLSDVITSPVPVAITSYKRLFLGNLLIFFMGMLMPSLLAGFKRMLSRKSLLVLAAILLAAAVWATDGKDKLFAQSELYLAPLLYLIALLFCLSLIAVAPRLPFGRAVGSVGSISYPLYLLHIPFFMALATIGVIQWRNYVSVGYTLVALPLLLGGCFILGRGNDWVRQGVGSRLFADW